MAIGPAGLAPNLPAGSPPPGVLPNYVNPPSKGPLFYYVGTMLLFIMIVIFAMRMFVKFRITKKRTWDDLTCSIAAVGTTLYFVVVVLSVTKGKFGTHSWDVPAAHLVTHDFIITAYLLVVLAPPLWYVTRLTFFLLYLEIFKPFRWFRYCTYTGMAVTTAGYLAFTIVAFYCTTPAPGQTWAESLRDLRYAKEFNVSVPVTAFGLAVDICIFVLPITGVSGLKLSQQRKLGVMAIFLTGLGSVIATTISLAYKVRLYQNYNDFMYLSFIATICAFFEMCVGVIVSCMPTLSLLTRHSTSKSVWSRATRSDPSKTMFKTVTLPSLKDDHGHEKGQYVNLSGNQSRKSVNTPRDIELGQLQTSITGDSQGVPPQGGIYTRCEMQQWSERR